MIFRKISKGGGVIFNWIADFGPFIKAFSGKKCNIIFRKWGGGGQSLLGTFPKIHPFWYPDPSQRQRRRQTWWSWVLPVMWSGVSPGCSVSDLGDPLILTGGPVQLWCKVVVDGWLHSASYCTPQDCWGRQNSPLSPHIRRAGPQEAGTQQWGCFNRAPHKHWIIIWCELEGFIKGQEWELKKWTQSILIMSLK